MIEYNGYLYTLEKTKRNKKYWRCKNRECKARCTTEIAYEAGNIPENISLHNHLEQTDLINALKRIEVLKHNALSTCISPREIVRNAMTGASRSVMEQAGGTYNLSQAVNYARRQSIDREITAINELNLPTALLYTLRGSLFYQYGPQSLRNLPEYRNVVVFFNYDLINDLAAEPIWCIDGTFSISPIEFKQLYTISFIKNNHVIPTVFFILKNKEMSTYREMLLIFTALVPNLRPQIIIADFEIGAINIFKVFFPFAEIKGCLFHLSQNIIKNVKNNGYMNQFRENENFKIFIRALICLAFIPIETISDVFEFLLNHPRRPLDTNLTYNYFYINYIGSTSQRLINAVLFPIELWSSRSSLVYNVPRTNNAIEGWHAKLNRDFEAKCQPFANL